MFYEATYLIRREKKESNRISDIYECSSLKKIKSLDSKENYQLIATFPFLLELNKSFSSLEELSRSLKKYREEDRYFREILDLVVDTYNISYMNSERKNVTGSLYVAVSRAYDTYLTPLNYEIGKDQIEKRDPYGTKETVAYGITTIIHKENVERAFMRIAERGEVNFSDLDFKTKNQMVKLNDMRFVDYRSGKFVLREFEPEEFYRWLSGIGSYYSAKYKLRGNYSMLLNKSIGILHEVRTKNLQ